MSEANLAQDNDAEETLAGVPSKAAPTDLAELPERIIRPGKGWLTIDFAELWHYRELLFFLVWRDVKIRYKQTVLGAAWAIIQPVFSMVIFSIFSIIFGNFARIPSDGVPYPIFVFAGLLPWTFFANAVSMSGISLVSQAGILTKVYFPRLYVPAASVGVALVDFALSFAVYVCIMLWYMHLPGPSLMLLPLLIILAIVAASGIGFVLASITVTYRDFKYVIPFTIQAWMYASPVVYPISLLPEKYRWIMALNPMAGIIGGFRSSLLDQPVDWQSLAISSAVAVALFVFGLYNFRRTERRFADIV